VFFNFNMTGLLFDFAYVNNAQIRSWFKQVLSNNTQMGYIYEVLTQMGYIYEVLTQMGYIYEVLTQMGYISNIQILLTTHELIAVVPTVIIAVTYPVHTQTLLVPACKMVSRAVTLCPLEACKYKLYNLKSLKCLLVFKGQTKEIPNILHDLKAGLLLTKFLCQLSTQCKYLSLKNKTSSQVQKK